MDTVEILKKARWKVAQGWTQGASMVLDASGSERYCAAGAIESISSPPSDLFTLPASASLRAIDALAEPVGGVDALISWNDAPGRTQQDVLDLYDRVIESLS